MTKAYDDDFYAWTQEQAALLRGGRLADADVEHLIEESLKAELEKPESIERAYARAKRIAAAETGLSPTNFPAACPYSAPSLLEEPDQGA
jgi:hypothetical protein